MQGPTTRILLDEYRPADATETGHHRRMLELLKAGACAFDRNYFTPGHFTASAFVLSPDCSQMLLILHGKLNLWLQPGGHVETEDATLSGAARREVLEETGLASVELIQSAPIDVDVHTIPARKDSPAHEHFDVRFLFRAGSISHEAQSDALAAQWVDLMKLEHLQTDESVMRAVRKIRQLLQHQPSMLRSAH